jgi:DNA-directed RNA polymerase subunit RPC12/RpoP
MTQTCDRCGTELIREELEDGNVCFDCFNARVLETMPEETVVEKTFGGSE